MQRAKMKVCPLCGTSYEVSMTYEHIVSKVHRDAFVVAYNRNPDGTPMKELSKRNA